MAAAVPLAVVAVLVAVSLAGDEPSGRVVTGAAGGGPGDEPGGPSPATSGTTAKPCRAVPTDGPAADQVLERFFAARIGRDWMRPRRSSRRDSHRRSAGRDGFIGPSSPHVDRFTVSGDLDRTPGRVRLLGAGPTSRPAPTGPTATTA